MDVSDWASVATIIVATITILGVLTKRIDKVETKLDAKIDKTREDSRSDIAELRNEFRFLSRTIVDFLAHPPERTAPSRSE